MLRLTHAVTSPSERCCDTFIIVGRATRFKEIARVEGVDGYNSRRPTSRSFSP
ncbi:MAG: hypothetical protein U0792_10355 [Gemmataceae bacterium]